LGQQVLGQQADIKEVARGRPFSVFDHDPVRLNRIMIVSLAEHDLGQALRVCSEGKPVTTLR
jgi:hypothetical protein